MDSGGPGQPDRRTAQTLRPEPPQTFWPVEIWRSHAINCDQELQVKLWMLVGAGWVIGLAIASFRAAKHG